MRKQPEVTERTRAALRRAFWELYAGADGQPPLPVEKVSVRAITERAGYNRATFYLYYRDVYELLGQIEEETLASARDVVEGRIMASGELDFSGHMSYIAELARTGGPYFSVLMGPHGDPAFVEAFKRVVRPLVERFLVGEAAGGPAERDLLSEFYLSGLVAVVSRWVAKYPEMPVEEFIPLVVARLVQ